MNCLKVDQGDGMALKEPSMVSSSSGVMTGGTGAASMSVTTTPSAASVSGAAAGRNIRSWSSSHVDSVGESTHSKNSMESNETWRRLRLQQILYKSVLNNDLDMVIKCVQHGADIREEYLPHCHTILHVSACRGYLKLTELLLRAGCNPNTLDEKAFLPLHYAAQEGHFHTVRCLILYGSMVTVENEYGDAPLHTAVRYGHSDLLPLVLAVDIRRDFNNANSANVPEKLANTDHLDLQNANGDTALHIAAALDKKSIVKKLLQWGADPSVRNHQGLSALQIAMDRNFLSVAKLLRQSPVIYTSGQAHAQALSSHGAYPFKDTDGLQRYTDEVTRQRMEEEAALLAQIRSPEHQPIFDYNAGPVFQQESPLTRSQSHTRIPQRERMGGLDMMTGASPAPQSVDSAGLLLSTTNSVSVSSPPSSMRHPTGGVSSALMQTKTVELDPQPNNVNAELIPGQRVSRLQRAGTSIDDFRRSKRSEGHTVSPDRRRTPSPRSLTTREAAVAAAANLRPAKSVSDRMDKMVTVREEKREQRQERVAERFDRLIDGRTTAEAIEGRLRDMNGHQDQPQHQQQIPQHQQRNAESKGGRQNGSAADKENRGSSSVYIAAVDKSSSKGGNSKVGRPRTTTKIKISYDDGGGAGKKKSQQLESRTVQTHADSEAASAVAAANRSLEETWRRPLDRVVMVRDVAVDSSSIDGGSANNFPDVNGDNINGHEESVKSEEDLFDENGAEIKLTEIRNGRKVIKQAPTLRDYYTSHIGRVSPKIKDLQEQLRQAQYKSFTDDSL